MLQNTFADESPLVQVMAWSRQARTDVDHDLRLQMASLNHIMEINFDSVMSNYSDLTHLSVITALSKSEQNTINSKRGEWYLEIIVNTCISRSVYRSLT